MNLSKKLDEMTQIAEKFNLQLQLLYKVMGHEEFNKIVESVMIPLKTSSNPVKIHTLAEINEERND
jgi:hypothetical protein